MHKTMSERSGGGNFTKFSVGRFGTRYKMDPIGSKVCKNERSIRSKTNEKWRSIGSKIETKIDAKWRKVMQNPYKLLKLDQLYVHVSLELNMIDAN